MISRYDEWHSCRLLATGVAHQDGKRWNTKIDCDVIAIYWQRTNMSPALKILPILLPLLVLPVQATAAEIDELSLDDLQNISITTASKFSQPISESPSSATVIRGEEILEVVERYGINDVLGKIGAGVDLNFLKHLLMLVSVRP